MRPLDLARIVVGNTRPDRHCPIVVYPNGVVSVEDDGGRQYFQAAEWRQAIEVAICEGGSDEATAPGEVEP